jgi:hypothetical protein
MRFFRLFVATLWLIALGFSAVPAHAATLSISPPRWEKRDSGRLINKFNRKDCLDGAKATFSVSLVGAPANALFQVWSGTGCDNYANRSTTAISNTCTAVTAGLAPVSGDVVVNLRDMVAGFGKEVSNAEEQCDATTTASLQTRNLYFVVSDPSTNMTLVTGTGTPWTFTYDIKAPLPPSGVRADGGDGSLITTFTAPTGETNLLHYKFYCSPIGEPPVATGAGTGGTAGTSGTAGSGADTGGADTGGADTGGTAGTAGTAGTTAAEVNTDCPSSVLVAGQPPPGEGFIDCGEIAATGVTGGETEPVLLNDVKWVVAVATEDNVNNVGVLSNLACGVPKDTTGFFEAYGEAGGRAGGGFCAFAPAKHGGLATLVAFIIGACALVRRRK